MSNADCSEYVRAQLWPQPPRETDTAVLTPATRLPPARLIVVASPSWLDSLAPQQATEALAWTAQTCCWPAARSSPVAPVQTPATQLCPGAQR